MKILIHGLEIVRKLLQFVPGVVDPFAPDSCDLLGVGICQGDPALQPETSWYSAILNTAVIGITAALLYLVV
jgi:hypothetical protein